MTFFIAGGGFPEGSKNKFFLIPPCESPPIIKSPPSRQGDTPPPINREIEIHAKKRKKSRVVKKRDTVDKYM